MMKCDLQVLAGSCVGGGTSINWSASFNIPDHVREVRYRAVM